MIDHAPAHEWVVSLVSATRRRMRGTRDRWETARRQRIATSGAMHVRESVGGLTDRESDGWARERAVSMVYHA